MERRRPGEHHTTIGACLPCDRRDPTPGEYAAVASLAADGLIEGPRQVTHVWQRRVEHGYPTPSLERDAVLARLQPRLRERGILSRGRFGAWRYEIGNMDHTFMQGVEAAEHLLTGKPESTFASP